MLPVDRIVGKLRGNAKMSGSIGPIGSGGSGNVYSQEISVIKVLSKYEYDNIVDKDPYTLYLVKG